MHELERWLSANVFNGRRRSFGRNAMALIRREDQPTDFINRLFPPGLPPISNVPYAFSVRTPDDLEHVICSIFVESGIADVAPQDLFRGLGSSKVFHNVRIAQELSK